jgi:hypothetical protein
MPWISPNDVETGAAPSSNAYALTVNGANILAHVPTDEQPITWEDQAANAIGTMQFVVEDRAAWSSRVALPRGAHVVLRDLTQSMPLFGGTLTRVRYTRGATGRFAECEVVDHDWWLDHRIVPRWKSVEDVRGHNRRISSDRDIVKTLIERRAGFISATNAYVSATNTDMPVITIEGKTLREALEQVADVAQSGTDTSPRRFYVDHGLRFHWFKTSENEDAPYDVGGSGIEVEDLEVEYDGSDIVHHVYVRGKNAAGSGWVQNTGSDFALGAVAAFIDREWSDSVTDLNRLGRAFLRRQEEVVAGSFYVQQTTGWRSGQTVTITDSQLGLSAQDFEIRSVSGELGLGDAHSHRIEFGAPRRSLVKQMRSKERPYA